MSSAPDGAGDGLERAKLVQQRLYEEDYSATPEEVEFCLRTFHDYRASRAPAVDDPVFDEEPEPFLGFEYALWDLSELLRKYLLRKRRLRGRCGVLDAVESIVRDKRCGKGRQNFVLILGQYGKMEYVATYAWGLDDRQIISHCISALTRVRAPGFRGRMEQIRDQSASTLARREAKAYLKKVNSPNGGSTE